MSKMENPKVTVQPTFEPVLLDEVKAWCYVEGTTDDAVLTSLIKTARSGIENFLNRTIPTTTYELTKDSFPSDYSSSETQDSGISSGFNVDYEAESKFYGISPKDIFLPMGKVQSVTSVKYYDKDGALQTVSTDVYELIEEKYITLKEGKTWPASGLIRDRGGVVITYVAGFAKADIPEEIKTAVKMYISSLYESRGCDASIPVGALKMALPYMRKFYVKPTVRTIQRS